MSTENNGLVSIDSENFEKEVLGNKKPVLLDFWAEWCMPCKMLDSTIEELAEEYKGKVLIGKINTDENRDISSRYDVTAIPTVILFRGGEVARKFIGLQQKIDLKNEIEEVLKG